MRGRLWTVSLIGILLTLPLAGDSATLSVALVGPGGAIAYAGGDRSIVITEPTLSGG